MEAAQRDMSITRNWKPLLRQIDVTTVRSAKVLGRTAVPRTVIP